jgi:hypothetical protein
VIAPAPVQVSTFEGGRLKPLFAFEWIFMFLDEAPKDGNKGSLWQKILSYAIWLLFWVILSAIGFWLMLELRGLIVELMIVAEFNPWAVRGFDRWILFVLGLGWFIALMWIEHYLRKGIDRGRLWRNIGYVASVQALITAVIFGIRFLIR